MLQCQLDDLIAQCQPIPNPALQQACTATLLSEFKVIEGSLPRNMCLFFRAPRGNPSEMSKGWI